MHSILAENDKKCHREVTNNGRREDWGQTGGFYRSAGAANSRAGLARESFIAWVLLDGLAHTEGLQRGPIPTRESFLAPNMSSQPWTKHALEL